MSRKEVPRAGLLKAARAGEIGNAQGTIALFLGVRQLQRVNRRYAADGAPELLHRVLGRPSPRRGAHRPAYARGRLAPVVVTAKLVSRLRTSPPRGYLKNE